MKKVRLLSVSVSLLLLVFGLSSCALLQKPEESEMKEAMEKLLPVSREATDIIYGEGIRIDENFVIDPDWTTAHYAPVSYDYKYQTVDDLKLLIRSAFSEEYAEEMYEYAFVSNDEFMSRFGEKNGKLTMDVTKEPFHLATDIYTETAKVVSGSGYACVVEVEMSNDGGATRYTERLRLVKENDQWKFDGPTY